MSRKALLIAVIGLALLSLGLAACATTGEDTPADTPAVECPEPEPCPDCPTCPAPVVDTVPFEEAWAGSGHADETAEAFRHWDEDDPMVVEVDCAKCHSSAGFQDFVGADGSAAGVVDAAPAPEQAGITCAACHNGATAGMTSVVFPSGIEITDIGPSARCMQCHQGRAAGATVDAKLEELGLTEDLDTPNEGLRFINIHYYAAAATLFGAEAAGGYQYADNVYPIRFPHVEGYQECADCHDTHTLELKIEECAVCHTGVASVEDLYNVRMQGSLADYDGDGDVSEGIYYEIAGLQEALYAAIQAYAADAGAPIIFDAASYPYWFGDANGDGAIGEDEGAYAAWTGRLLKAAYNYQVALKDPGGFAHNAKYLIALLYDSIADLGGSTAGMARNDPGHFDSTAEAFRHWDEDGEVDSGCVKCHTDEGLPFFLDEGVFVSREPANSLSCHTCHTFEEGIGVLAVTEVEFPSGAVLAFAENPESNLCLECHQARNSGEGIASSIARAGVGLDVVTDQLAARGANPHYFAAGATLFGTEAGGPYEFDGKTYAGRFVHMPSFDACSECHNVHALELKVEECASCHGTTDVTAIRMSEVDYDGDGDVTEGMAGEVATMEEKLLEAMQTYAEAHGGAITASDEYPYWLNEAGEAYAAFTPRLFRAAYNYNWVAKDPGAFAHNGLYMIQIMYDTIQDLGGSTAGLTRP